MRWRAHTWTRRPRACPPRAGWGSCCTPGCSCWRTMAGSSPPRTRSWPRWRPGCSPCNGVVRISLLNSAEISSSCRCCPWSTPCTWPPGPSPGPPSRSALLGTRGTTFPQTLTEHKNICWKKYIDAFRRSHLPPENQTLFCLLQKWKYLAGNILGMDLK